MKEASYGAIALAIGWLATATSTKAYDPTSLQWQFTLLQEAKGAYVHCIGEKGYEGCKKERDYLRYEVLYDVCSKSEDLVKKGCQNYIYDDANSYANGVEALEIY